MPSSFIHDPGHWHNRAEEARTLADQMNDEVSKQMMLRIAADYDKLAERAVLRARDRSATPPKGSSPAVDPVTADVSLILKRARVSRPSGEWRDDDYDVLENGVVIGRIFCLDAVGPQGRPSM